MSTTCLLAIHRFDSGYLIRLTGRGTMRESPAVREFAGSALEAGAGVVLDLSACEYLDSTFLGCLVILNGRGAGAPGSFAVVADEATRRKLMHCARLDRILRFIDRCPECRGESFALPESKLEREEFCRHLLESHRRLAELGGPEAATFQGIAEQLAKELDRDAP